MEGAATSSHDRTFEVQLHNAELIKFRDERKTLTFVLTSGETLEGFVRWFDDHAVHVVISGPERSETTVFKHAITRYQVK